MPAHRRPAAPPWTPEQAERALADYARMGIEPMAALYRLGKRDLRARLVAAGAEIRRQSVSAEAVEKALAMMRDGAGYPQITRETGLSATTVRHHARRAGVTYAPAECPHAANAHRRWADPAQRERHGEMSRTLMRSPAFRESSLRGLRTAWAERFPHMARLTPAQLAEFRRYRTKGFPIAEALRLVGADPADAPDAVRDAA